MYKLKDNSLQYKTEIKNGFEALEPGNNGIIETKKLKEFTNAMNSKKKNPFLYNTITSLNKQKEEEKEENISLQEYISFIDNELKDAKSREGLKKIFSVFCDDLNNFSWTKFALIAQELGDNEMAQKLLKLIEQAKLYNKDLNFFEFSEIMNEEYKKKMKNKNYNEDYEEKETYKEKRKKKIVKKEEEEDMGTISSGKNEEIRDIDGEKSNKRYHRRYRDSKTKNENNENGNVNKIHSKYRKKHI